MSFAAHGAMAWGDLPAALRRAVMLPWRGEGESSTRSLVVVAEVETYHPADGRRIDYFGTHDFMTTAWDDPPEIQVQGRLIPGVLLRQEVPTAPAGHFGGVASRALGEIELDNADAALDALPDRACDGRRVTLRIGRMVEPGTIVHELRPVLIGVGDDDVASEGAFALVSEPVPTPILVHQRRVGPWSEMGRVAVAAGDGWEHGLDRLRLALQDMAASLRVPAQTRRYRGTGGVDGPAALADQTRPLTLGRCLQVPLTLVDPARLIYQVHDGRIAGVDAVYDRGVPLTGGVTPVAGGYQALAAQPAALGGYATSLRAGLIRLGSPPAGQVTADVRGAVLDVLYGAMEPWDDGLYDDDGYGWADTLPGPGYREDAAGLVLTLLTLSARWTRDRLHWESFLELARSFAWPMGLHLPAGSGATVEQAIQQICEPVGIVASPDRLGRYRVRLLARPNVPTPRRFRQGEILELEREALPYRAPPRAWPIGYAKNWRVLGEADLAGDVEPERRAELGRPCRVATTAAPDVVLRHLTAREPATIETCLATEAGARDVGARMAALYRPGAMALRLRVPRLLAGDLGDPIMVAYPRYDLGAGRDLIITGVGADLGRPGTEIRAFG